MQLVVLQEVEAMSTPTSRKYAVRLGKAIKTNAVVPRVNFGCISQK